LAILQKPDAPLQSLQGAGDDKADNQDDDIDDAYDDLQDEQK
jgi:hypothetical protein